MVKEGPIERVEWMKFIILGIEDATSEGGSEEWKGSADLRDFSDDALTDINSIRHRRERHTQKSQKKSVEKVRYVNRITNKIKSLKASYSLMG